MEIKIGSVQCSIVEVSLQVTAALKNCCKLNQNIEWMDDSVEWLIEKFPCSSLARMINKELPKNGRAVIFYCTVRFYLRSIYGLHRELDSKAINDIIGLLLSVRLCVMILLIDASPHGIVRKQFINFPIFRYDLSELQVETDVYGIFTT